LADPLEAVAGVPRLLDCTAELSPRPVRVRKGTVDLLAGLYDLG
jgi:hypothetical protein